MMLSGWGRYRAESCRVLQPRSRDDLTEIVKREPSLIARGNGRSYGDAAINSDATIIMTGLNRFIEFDCQNGIVHLEAGVLLSDLLDIAVPKGWFPLVTPGTKFITIGGAIACDVHGKNHHQDGSFRQCVLSFSLLDGAGQLHHCSPDTKADLFDATLGGMGLTGIIVDATLQLRSIESAYIVNTTDRCTNLTSLFDIMSERSDSPYTVAWIDCTAKQTSLGRGIVFSGRHARIVELAEDQRHEPLKIKYRKEKRIWLTPPIDVMRRPILKAFNSLYYAANKPGTKLVDYDRYFYPLDAISDWNRIYGSNGFVQFQCVVPRETGKDTIRALLNTIAQAGTGSPLAVLKYLGPGSGNLSFPFEGYTLALDFPVHPNVIELQDRLNAIATADGGRLYFAKDATASRQTALNSYDLTRFHTVRTTLTGHERFRSSLSSRIGLTP